MRASRHPHRAVRRPGPNPLPDRRRADGARQRPRAACSVRSSAVSRSWGRSTSPRSGGPRTAGSRSSSPARISTCVSASYQPRMASRWSCGSSTATTSRSGSRTWGSATTTSPGSRPLIKRPNGILLVTGPTGSGKTTTLYAALNELNRPDVKIITAEDPVEYYLPGVNQCEVKAKIGMTFARIIRAMLRQNPEHPPGGRNPRFGDGRDRNSGSSDRTLGFQYIAHERCAQCHYTSGRYRHPAVPGCQLGACNHGAAAGAESLSQVQGAVRAARASSRRVWGCGPRSPRRPTS